MCDTFFKSAEQSTTSKMSERKVLNVSICRYYIREIIAFVISKHWFSVNTGNAFQCQKMLYTNHEEEEPPLLHIKQPNPGTSTIKPLPRTTSTIKPLPRTTSTIKPLPRTIAEDIKWKEHINNTCKKASSTFGFLRRNLQHCPRGYRVVSPRLPVCLWSIRPGKWVDSPHLIAIL